MSSEEHLRIMRENRADLLDQADAETDPRKAAELEAAASGLWEAIQLLESELLAKREDMYQAKQKGEI